MYRRRFLALLLPWVTGCAVGQTIWPPPPEPPGNPTTPDKVLLGKALFWDEQLSSTDSVACGTCHVFSHGGADPRAPGTAHPGPDGLPGTADDGRGSPGVPPNDGSGAYGWVPWSGSGPQVTRRTAPSVINAAYQNAQFWDGRVESGVFRDPDTGQVVLHANAWLENQIALPPLSAVEMGHPGRSWADIAQLVQDAPPLATASAVPAPLAGFVAGRTYPQLFQRAFGTPVVDGPRVIMAIASYLRTLVSDRSPIDLFLAGQAPFPPAAAPGFVEFGLRCSQCHGDLGSQSVATGPITVDYRNIGVRPNAEDRGRAAVTGLAADEGRFKSPDLRNVALRGPFFHNGSAATLHDVMQFYERGGDFHVNQDPLVAGMQGQLPPATRAAIIAFLHELTDPRVAREAPPFDRPRLFSEGPHRNVSFGSGTAGTAGAPPRAIAVEAPRLGKPFLTVGLDGALPGEHALIVLDVSPAAAPLTIAGVEVLLALTPASTATYAGALHGGVGPESGHLSWPLPLTASPAAAGQSIYGQWLVTDPAGPGGFAASGAFRLTLF